MYDWANSAYSTLSITVLFSYLQDVLPIQGKIVWGWGIGLTGLVAAVLSPILGAVADAHASKRGWLACTALSGAAASSLMYFTTPQNPWLVVALFIVAQIGYELSQGFYNAFLPELADEQRMGRVSAFGYALGYVGGGLALVLFLLLYANADRFGVPRNDPGRWLPRAGLLLMGLWWGLFSLPTLLLVRDRNLPKAQADSIKVVARRAVREVFTTLRNIRGYRMLTLFLVGFLLFNDGVQTVITQASVFAKEVLSMSSGELAQLVLMIQFVALPGAWIIGQIGDRVGQKFALNLCLTVWVGLLCAALFVDTKPAFWALGVVLALVMGGIQSVSRAIMGLLTPADRTGEFFGFFNLSGKAFSVFGPIFFSSILTLTGNAQLALASLLVFFLAGWAFIYRLDIQRGQREASGVK